MSTSKFFVSALILFTAFSTFYFSAGVFLGTVRFDELFFASVSWSISNNFISGFEHYAPPLYLYLLGGLWDFVGDNVLGFLIYSRLVTFALFCTTFFLISAILASSDTGNNWGKLEHLRIALAIVICGYLAAVRGFEIRPEALSNTLLLLLGTMLLRFESAGEKWKKIIFFCFPPVSLLLSLLSFRYVAPTSILYVAFLAEMLATSRGQNKWNTPIKFLLYSFALLIVSDVFIFPIHHAVEQILQFQDTRTSVSFAYKIFSLGLWKELPGIYNLLYWRLCFIIAILLLLIHPLRHTQIFISRARAATAGMLFLSFYLLFFFEKRPFNYVISTECCIWLLTSAIALKAKADPFPKFRVVIVLALIAVSIPQIFYRLHSFRNTEQAMVWIYQDFKERSRFQSMTSETALSALGVTRSLISQGLTRNRLCKVLSAKAIAVVNHNIHPVCVRDNLSKEIAWERATLTDINNAILAAGGDAEIIQTSGGEILTYTHRYKIASPLENPLKRGVPAD